MATLQNKQIFLICLQYYFMVAMISHCKFDELLGHCDTKTPTMVDHFDTSVGKELRIIVAYSFTTFMLN